jgi:hypothetical protein
MERWGEGCQVQVKKEAGWAQGAGSGRVGGEQPCCMGWMCWLTFSHGWEAGWSFSHLPISLGKTYSLWSASPERRLELGRLRSASSPGIAGPQGRAQQLPEHRK